VGAFQLLPGLLQYSSRTKDAVLTLAQHLAGITASGDISHEILHVASCWQDTLRARPPLDHIRPFNPEATRARIEALSKVGHLSSATRVCKNLDNHLKGHSPAPQLTHLIQQLDLTNDDRDIIPDRSFDHPIETPIQVTPH
jgi:hypothetical protein